MKECPNCKNVLDDNALFCTACGAKLGAEQPQQQYTGPQYTAPQYNAPQYNAPQYTGAPYGQPQYAPAYDPYDHTKEFEEKDISDNKVIAMLIYLMGVVGVIIALLASSTSAYVGFHIRQSLKITVVTILAGLVTAVLCWTIIVPILFGILVAVLTVIRVICFFQICAGKAVEPAIIRSLKFLK